MWLWSRTSLHLLILLVGLARADEDDASDAFVEEAKNLFNQKSIENMAHTFAQSQAGKQVRSAKNSYYIIFL